MSFKTKKYQVIRGTLSKELANFIFNYMLLQRQAVEYLLKHNKISQTNPFIGVRNDDQVSDCYSKYGDWVTETLLEFVRPVMKAKTGMDLIPTYSYTRLYEKGNILHRHKDRGSCEVSTTIHLGGEEWPIYLDPTGDTSVIDDKKHIVKPGASQGIRIDLKVGDMLMYSGCELEHWREPFQGTVCSQVFLHYNNSEGSFARRNVYDKRPLLGVPQERK
tara:strand:+ start:195 stop:848 length:654 start_codon:yes stop_codon:yes gene_type:complete